MERDDYDANDQKLLFASLVPVTPGTKIDPPYRACTITVGRVSRPLTPTCREDSSSRLARPPKKGHFAHEVLGCGGTLVLLRGAARMHIRRLATHIEVQSPAKINLFLEVLGKRPDGYHEIETVLVAVTIFDTLTFISRSDGGIKLECRWASGLAAAAIRRKTAARDDQAAPYGEIPPGRDNLAWRAVALLRERAGVKQGGELHFVKRIPVAAGLGGASSDAAAALVAASAGWRLDWSRERLAELAAELGSDVPFFLTRGAAVCRGRGERVEPLTPPRLHLVVVRPPLGLETPEVYQACRPTDAPVGVGVIKAALARGNAAAVGRALSNGLEMAAAGLNPWIEKMRQELERVDVLGHQMSGSGSSYFGLCRSARHARRIAARLRARSPAAVFSATTAVAA